jgi:hypothetical protein
LLGGGICREIAVSHQTRAFVGSGDERRRPCGWGDVDTQLEGVRGSDQLATWNREANPAAPRLWSALIRWAPGPHDGIAPETRAQ